MRRRSLALASAALLAPPLAARAFPDRTITMITGYAPGGSTDIAARILADRMASHLGPEARIVVENRPGAAGTVATEWLKRQPPDGHTVMVTETGAAAAAFRPMAHRFVGTERQPSGCCPSSTTTCWPSVRDMWSPTIRAMTSVGPPAANGTIMVTGRCG